MNSQVRGFKALLFVGTAGVLASPAIVSAQEVRPPQTAQPIDCGVGNTPATTAPDASGNTGANQIIVVGSRIARR